MRTTEAHWGWMALAIGAILVAAPAGYYVAPVIAPHVGVDTALLRLAAAVVWAPACLAIVIAATRTKVVREYISGSAPSSCDKP